MDLTGIKHVDVYEFSGFSAKESEEFKSLEELTKLSSYRLLGLYSLYSGEFNKKDKNLVDSLYETVNMINYFAGRISHKNSDLSRLEHVNYVIDKLVDNKKMSLFNVQEDLKQLENDLYLDSSFQYSDLDKDVEVGNEVEEDVGEKIEEDVDIYSKIDEKIDLDIHFKNLIDSYKKSDEEFKNNPSNIFWGNRLTKSSKRQNDEFLAKLYFSGGYDSLLYSNDTFSVISLDVLHFF